VVENAVAVEGPDTDDREFGFEVDKGFEYCLPGDPYRPMRLPLRQSGDSILTLAVVTETGGFQDR